MKFLADAHISAELVSMIRASGHDCADGLSIPVRMPDVDVLRMASEQGRIVVTADKDFGELVFVHSITCPGVVLLRIGVPSELDRVTVLRSFWPLVISRLPGSFITVSAAGVRARPLA